VEHDVADGQMTFNSSDEQFTTIKHLQQNNTVTEDNMVTWSDD